MVPGKIHVSEQMPQNEIGVVQKRRHRGGGKGATPKW